LLKSGKRGMPLHGVFDRGEADEASACRKFLLRSFVAQQTIDSCFNVICLGHPKKCQHAAAAHGVEFFSKSEQTRH
jgi:hypothetical protein